MIELFSTVTFLRIKDGGSVSVTAGQQTYCASNLEQGGFFFFANFLFLAITAKQYNNTKKRKKKKKKNITYNLNITYSPDGTYTTTTIKINTNKPNITYYKHMQVTVITNTSILCYGERKENGIITMQTPAF